jgi:phosphoribosylformylglycinamidine cyclo-ligase
MSITYSQVGDDYDRKDPVKKIAQSAAAATGTNLTAHDFTEHVDSRGESAYVWKQGDVHMAACIEGLGTKNIVADHMRAHTGKTYYDIIGHETVATIINDLTTVGAAPLVVHAYWAVGSNDWFGDAWRLHDLVAGWKSACDIAGAAWGGGESPTLTSIVSPEYIDLGGSSVGIIKDEKRLLTDARLCSGDRIILLKSTGINANGVSLARAVAERLPNGYATRLSDGTFFGEAILNKTNIYAKMLNEIFAADIDLHYISNLTGHGLRKIMRAKGAFTYTIEHIFEPQQIFHAIASYAELTPYQMYETYNMGQDYALFVAQADVGRALNIISSAGFEAIDAGYVRSGKRQVIIKPNDIIFRGNSMNLR